MNKIDKGEFWRRWWERYKKALKDDEAPSLLTGVGLALIVFGIFSMAYWKTLSTIAVLFGAILVITIPVAIFLALRKRYKNDKKKNIWKEMSEVEKKEFRKEFWKEYRLWLIGFLIAAVFCFLIFSVAARSMIWPMLYLIVPCFLVCCVIFFFVSLVEVGKKYSKTKKTK